MLSAVPSCLRRVSLVYIYLYLTCIYEQACAQSPVHQRAASAALYIHMYPLCSSAALPIPLRRVKPLTVVYCPLKS